MEVIMSLKNLNLNLDKKRILKNISLDIYSGEVLAVIGPNGCGKTSLAYTIMGLQGYKVDSGKIFFKGEDITKMKIDLRARKGITLAWQEPSRFEGISVRDFLAVGLKSRGKEVTEGKLAQALKEVAIIPEKYLTRKIDKTLSGGERKRIEMASILLMEPDLVILDEPDSGVDVIALNNIGTVIDSFRKNNVGVLLITHSDEILKYANRAVLICNGKIIKKGEPAVIREYFNSKCIPCPEEDYILEGEEIDNE